MIKTKLFVAAAILMVCVTVLGGGVSASALSGETRYADAPTIAPYANERIDYTRKEVVAENYTDGDCPMYTSTSDLTNACGAVAGAEIVAFYDKYFPELIPNWSPTYSSSDKYRRQDSVYVPALMRELYTLMRTNVDDVGVSKTDFLNGLSSYINGKGRAVSYQNVKSGNAIDFNQCKNAIDNNKVIALLVLPTTVCNITNASGYDLVMPVNISGAHIMVVYGYLKINYYNNSGLFRTDTYLAVSVGKIELNFALYRVDATTTDGAYIVNIQ